MTRSRSPKPRIVAEMTRVLEVHSQTDARWLDYELDAAKLLDYPMMTDMRDSLTMRFHKAKLRADLLRPVKVEDLLGDRDAQPEYRDAVHDDVSAFQGAEADAIRRRRSDFSTEGQQWLARAQSLLRLAWTPRRQRRNASTRMTGPARNLMVLSYCPRWRASIERGIAGQIEA